MKISNFLLITVIIIGCSNKNSKIITGKEGAPLPSFKMLLLDSSTHFDVNEIPPGNPIVFFYFSPDCPYCLAETEEVIRNIKQLGGIQFCFCSSFDFNLIKNFNNEYKLTRFKNITVVQDNMYSFGRYFQVRSVPFIAIYNKDQKLKSVYSGKVDANTIKSNALDL